MIPRFILTNDKGRTLARPYDFTAEMAASESVLARMALEDRKKSNADLYARHEPRGA